MALTRKTQARKGVNYSSKNKHGLGTPLYTCINTHQNEPQGSGVCPRGPRSTKTGQVLNAFVRFSLLLKGESLNGRAHVPELQKWTISVFALAQRGVRFLRYTTSLRSPAPARSPAVTRAPVGTAPTALSHVRGALGLAKDVAQLSVILKPRDYEVWGLGHPFMICTMLFKGTRFHLQYRENQ